LKPPTRKTPGFFVSEILRGTFTQKSKRVDSLLAEMPAEPKTPQETNNPSNTYTVSVLQENLGILCPNLLSESGIYMNMENYGKILKFTRKIQLERPVPGQSFLLVFQQAVEIRA